MFGRKLILVLIYFIESSDCIAGDVRLLTTSGVVNGQVLRIDGQEINEFVGIPYAKPPVGRQRFSKPMPINKLFENLDARQHRSICYQQPGPSFDISGSFTMSEDCLVLNIWSQNSKNKTYKPVMFWIHGGFLKSGSIYLELYNGSVLATRDIVLVSANYRLGKLGFLYGGSKSAPGNLGFYDQLLALKWVRDNIHMFGGDKNQITIFGESTGAWSVTAHLLSPLSRDLFKRAIMESGAILHNKDRPVLSSDEAVSEAKQLAKRLNCTESKDWLKCLRRVDPKDIVEADKENQRSYPIFGTEFLPMTTQKALNTKNFYSDVPLIAGLVRNEGSILAYASDPEFFSKNLTEEDFITYAKRMNKIYHNMDIEAITRFYLRNIDTNDSEAIKQRIFDFYGDVVHKCPIYLFAKRYAEESINKSKVYFYEWNYKSRDQNLVNLVKNYLNIPNSVTDTFGVFHGSELPFVFGLPLMRSDFQYRDEIEFTERILNLWSNFAKYGKADPLWKPMMSRDELNSPMITTLNPFQSNSYIEKLFETCNEFFNDFYFNL